MKTNNFFFPIAVLVFRCVTARKNLISFSLTSSPESLCLRTCPTGSCCSSGTEQSSFKNEILQLEMKTNMWNSLNSIITFLLVWWRSSPWRNCVSNLFTYWQNKVTVECSQHVWLLTALWVNLSKDRPIGQFVQGLTGLWVNMFKGKQVCGSTCPRVNRSVVQHVQG